MRLENGTGCLWQWNTGQKIILDNCELVTAVSFSVDQINAVRRDVCISSSSKKYVEIPNKLLQIAGTLYIYFHNIEEDGCITTVRVESYRIKSQPKPPDYINDDDEVLTWHQLDKRIEILEGNTVRSVPQILQPEQQAQARDNIGAQERGDYVIRSELPRVPDWAMQPQKPKYTAKEVGADPANTAVKTVGDHNAQPNSHADIRLLIQKLTEKLNTVANSNDANLDQLKEIADYIKDNRNQIEQITSGKVSVTDIINNLTTNLAEKPLSAAMGVELKKLIDAINVPTALSDLMDDIHHRTVTDIEKSEWNSKLSQNDLQKWY